MRSLLIPIQLTRDNLSFIYLLARPYLIYLADLNHLAEPAPGIGDAGHNSRPLVDHRHPHHGASRHHPRVGGTARQAWVALEAQFLSNREARAFHLDASFRMFSQGDLSVHEYCCRMKGMADSLRGPDEAVPDCTLVLNFL